MTVFGGRLLQSSSGPRCLAEIMSILRQTESKASVPALRGAVRSHRLNHIHFRSVTFIALSFSCFEYSQFNSNIVIVWIVSSPALRLYADILVRHVLLGLSAHRGPKDAIRGRASRPSNPGHEFAKTTRLHHIRSPVSRSQNINLSIILLPFSLCSFSISLSTLSSALS